MIRQFQDSSHRAHKGTEYTEGNKEENAQSDSYTPPSVFLRVVLRVTLWFFILKLIILV